MAKRETLEFKRTIGVPPSEVFLAFTNPTALREWFCEVAQIEPHKGGRVYFAWHQGYYAAGEVTKISPGRKLAFTWAGRGEPDITDVEISIAARKNTSTIRILHAGVRSGKKWKQTASEIKRGWERGLENLQSVLETGQDQRFTMRPMLGVSGLVELTPEGAAQLGVPVERGIRIDGIVSGLGAEAAGLIKDDILVSLGEHRVTTWPSLVAALQTHRAGDKVAVGFYRGGKKSRVIMELSRRPLPDIPPTAAGLAQAVRQMYDSADTDLANALQGISSSEAAFTAGLGEWSVKEVLAHLVLGERDGHAWLAELVAGDERVYSQVGGNSQVRTQATAATYGSAPALLEELKRNESETVAMLAALPDEFVNRKRSYWRAAYSALQTADHTREHLHQIEAAVSAAREAAPVSTATAVAAADAEQPH